MKVIESRSPRARSQTAKLRKPTVVAILITALLAPTEN